MANKRLNYNNKMRYEAKHSAWKQAELSRQGKLQLAEDNKASTMKTQAKFGAQVKKIAAATKNRDDKVTKFSAKMASDISSYEADVKAIYAQKADMPAAENKA